MKLENVLKKFFVTALILGWPIIVNAASYREGNVINKTAQALDFTQIIDLSEEGVEGISFQAVLSTATQASETIVTGAKSTGSITVADYASLAEKKAQVTITISSNSTYALTNAIVTINGVPYRQGSEWTIGSSTRATATSLSNAIDAHPGMQSTHTLTTAALITASAAVVGSFANSWTVSSSTGAILVSAATLLGGQDNATIQIGTMVFTQGTDFNAVTSNGQTAENIENAITARTSLIIATRPHPNAIVFATATYNGYYDWPIIVSSRTALTVSGNGMSNGKISFIDVSTDIITYTGHGLQTGTAILFSTTAAQVAPGGLRNSVTYYAIRVDDNNYRLATSTTNAYAGTNIDITSLLLNSTSYTFAPLAYSGAANTGFYYSMSNDGVNFTTYTYVFPSFVPVIPSSFTYTGFSPQNAIWEYCDIAYKYLKVFFTGPTSGGLNFALKMFSRQK